MAGTTAGAAKSVAKILARDPEFFKTIGALGGKKGAKDGAIKGFALDHDRARTAGRTGGLVKRQK